jgi:hypothetical protein
MKDTEFTIRPFDMRKIKKESIIVLLGKRNTGKSILVRDILFHKRDIQIGAVVSHTDHLTHFYDNFIPSILINKEYTTSILEKLFDRQKKAIEGEWNKPHAFLLFDDCLSDAKTWAKDRYIKELFFNGRHYKLLFILAMQIPLGIPPSMRTNVDFTFILKNNNNADREKIYKNYAGMFSTKAHFESVLDACTEDYNCLVIDNTSQSNKIEDQVFYYKADLQGTSDFKLCSRNIWEISEKKKQSIAPNMKTKVSDRGNCKITVNRKLSKK